MRSWFWITAGLVVVLLFRSGFEGAYFECVTPDPSSGLCKNPLYEPSSWRNAEFLVPGRYGWENKEMMDFGANFAFFGFLVALVLNHLFFNRKFDFRQRFHQLKEEVDSLRMDEER